MFFRILAKGECAMYQALYRKWRPKVFSDVVGQEHITETLKKQVAEGRTSHAYLFTGTRGTGKTTCAKILAKAVNCEHPVNGDPCSQCASLPGHGKRQLFWMCWSWTPPPTTAWIRSAPCGTRRSIPRPR